MTSVVQEETFFVTLDVVEDGAVSPQRVEVSEALYRELKVGDAVEWRVLPVQPAGDPHPRAGAVVPSGGAPTAVREGPQDGPGPVPP